MKQTTKQTVYIDYLNKDKGFKPDRKYFATYENAVVWAKRNFEKFDPDMIKYCDPDEQPTAPGFNPADITELEALQNAANLAGLTVYEKRSDDRRQTVKRYFAQTGKETVSPVLDYEQMNHFLLGWIRAQKHLTEKK